MNHIELILKFKKSADKIFEIEDYTSSTILYFKTLFAVYDYIIFQKKGIISKDHTERFRILELDFPKEYEILDSEFNTYRSTYNRIISKETCIRIREIVENEIINHKIK